MDDLKSKDEIERKMRKLYDYVINIQEGKGEELYDVENYHLSSLGGQGGYFIKNDRELWEYRDRIHGSEKVAEYFTRDDMIDYMIHLHGDELAGLLPSTIF